MKNQSLLAISVCLGFGCGELSPSEHGLGEDAGQSGPIPEVDKINQALECGPTGPVMNCLPDPWPNATVPYRFGTDMASQDDDFQELLTDAFDRWTAKAFYLFVPYTNQTRFVTIKSMAGDDAEQDGASGSEVIWNLDPNADSGLITHEVGHLLGLPHEHQHNDRSQYITVDLANIPCDADSYGNNVQICELDLGFGSLGQFDYRSYMAYPTDAAGGNPQPPYYVDKAGNPLPTQSPTGGPSTIDASNALEVNAYQYGWFPFSKVGLKSAARISAAVEISGEPALVRGGFATDDLIAFVRGTDGNLYYKRSTSNGSSWGTWSLVPSGGTFSTAPAVASWQVGRVDIVARGSDGFIYHNVRLTNGTWNGWSSIGVPTSGTLSAPAMTTWGNRSLGYFRAR